MLMAAAMTPSLAIFCPGQGGQHRQMFDLARSDPATAQQLEHWWHDAGSTIALQAMLDDDQLLFANRHAQVLIVAASLALWQAIRHFAPPPRLVAGYSIGELSAYGIAGALTPANALQLAAKRAALMDACVAAGQPQGLAAVSGLRAASITEQLQRHGLSIAIETGADSFLVGGLRTGLAAFAASFTALGGKWSPLAVEVAAHTPMLQAAVAPFLAVLQQTPFNRPRCAVVAGVSAELVTRPEQAMPLLARQIATAIRWADCMDACVEAGVNAVLECGPGSALSRMMQARHPDVQCRSLADFRSLAGVEQWLGRL
jgi:[acyl-carrier-protein] S-malonyltransferase